MQERIHVTNNAMLELTPSSAGSKIRFDILTEYRGVWSIQETHIRNIADVESTKENLIRRIEHFYI